MLGLRVDGGERIVEDEDVRLAHERAGERDALALSAGQLHAALPTTVSKPSGSESTSFNTSASAAAARIVSNAAGESGSSSEYPMLRATVVEKRNASCCA